MSRLGAGRGKQSTNSDMVQGIYLSLACSIPCQTYTRRVGLAWQLGIFSEMGMGKELGLDINVRVLT